MEKVFVYGTLRPGRPAFVELGDVGEIRPALLGDHGLFGLGRPYPFARPASGERVVGEVVEVAASVLVRLDAYEGDEYVREKATVAVDGGSDEAWVYVAAPGVDTGPPIPSGEWG